MYLKINDISIKLKQFTIYHYTEDGLDSRLYGEIDPSENLTTISEDLSDIYNTDIKGLQVYSDVDLQDVIWSNGVDFRITSIVETIDEQGTILKSIELKFAD